MQTLADKMRFLLSGMKTTFMANYKTAKPIYPEFTTEIKSTKRTEDYGRLGANSQMKEWIDERQPKGLRDFGFSLKNKHYENTIAIDVNDLEDDQYGAYITRVKMMPADAVKTYDRLAAQTVVDGNTTVCYDGQNFFDTDHQEGNSPTQANKRTNGSAALSVASIKQIAGEMRQLKDDEGNIAGIKPTHVMVPTDLEWIARSILDPQAVNGSTNPSERVLAGAYKIIVNDYLPNNGANSTWYMLDLSQGVAPFIFQNRKPVTPTSLDKDTDIEVFMRKKAMFGIDSRFAFGYGDWRLAYRAATS